MKTKGSSDAYHIHIFPGTVEHGATRPKIRMGSFTSHKRGIAANLGAVLEEEHHVPGGSEGSEHEADLINIRIDQLHQAGTIR